MNLQQPDNWIDKELHGTDQLEWCIRLLREKGVESNHSVIARAQDAMVKRGISQNPKTQIIKNKQNTISQIKNNKHQHLKIG